MPREMKKPKGEHVRGKLEVGYVDNPEGQDPVVYRAKRHTKGIIDMLEAQKEGEIQKTIDEIEKVILKYKDACLEATKAFGSKK